MKKIIIEGPSKLKGTINLQGSKNSMLINLVLPILTNEECVISNVPRIKDIELNLSILESLGSKIRWLDKHTVSIKCDALSSAEIDPKLSVKTTGSKFFIPLLVSRFGKVKTGFSLGDDIGLDRGFSKFLDLMKSLGIPHEKENDHYLFYSNGKEGKKDLRLDFPSFSATIGAVLGCVTGEDTTIIRNTHQASEIDNACDMLRAMGAKIQRHNNEIKVVGVKKLNGVNFRNMSDRNALVTYVTASLITNGETTINNIDDVKLEPFWDFLNKLGASYEKNKTSLIIYPSLSELKSVDIFAYMWPQFHSDWQPLVAPLLTQISGTSSIVDDLFESRLGYLQELGKMKASYEFFSPNNSRFNDGKSHGVKIHGPIKLHGSTVVAPDVRGGASLVIAGLAAEGRTTIENIDQIERGYEDIVGVLSSLTANIRYED